MSDLALYKKSPNEHINDVKDSKLPTKQIMTKSMLNYSNSYVFVFLLFDNVLTFCLHWQIRRS